MPRAKKEKQELSAEFIQSKIDVAESESFYYDVRDEKWKKHVVLGGAKKRWASDDDFVYAPGGRLCGPKKLVLAKLDEYEIEMKDLYENASSPGFADELALYRQTQATELLDDEAMEELKKSIRDNSSNPNLRQLLKSLPAGRAINVSEIADGKLQTVNSPLLTTLSRFVGVPGLDILSKTEEAYAQALEELEFDEEKTATYMDAYRALSKLQKPQTAPKTVKKAAPKGKK